jgi:hypothetical protein
VRDIKIVKNEIEQNTSMDPKTLELKKIKINDLTMEIKKLTSELNENYKILYDIYPAIITYDKSIHSRKIPIIPSLDIKEEQPLHIQKKEPKGNVVLQKKITDVKQNPTTPINNSLLPAMGGKILGGKTRHKKTIKSKMIKRTKKYRKRNKRNNKKTKRRIRKTRKY